MRRLHDIGITGWAILVHFVPYIGGIAFLIMMILPTKKGGNKWGPAPVARP
ncbi:MAG: DUF805 domain-containing protein [Pseudomonadota bacterium]